MQSGVGQEEDNNNNNESNVSEMRHHFTSMLQSTSNTNLTSIKNERHTQMLEILCDDNSYQSLFDFAKKRFF